MADREDQAAGISVVMAVHNGLDYTRGCQESLARCTAGELELIVVDNGSTDGTPEHFAAGGGVPGTIYIRNEKNLGCAAAWNQGMRNARHEWICVLNNDTRLPPNWDAMLRRIALQHGLSVVAPAFYEGDLDYPLDQASALHERYFGARIIPGAWNAICLVMHRDVIERVGDFDEGYRFGKYEDIDFIRRVGRARLRIGLACGLLIHHYGSKTIEAVRAEIGSEFEGENHRRFLRTFRWGRPERMLMKFRQDLIRRRERRFRRRSCALIASSRQASVDKKFF